MGGFLPASALDTFFIFLVPFFSLPPRLPFIVIFSAYFLLSGVELQSPVHRTGQNKRNGEVEERAVSSFLATTWASYYVLFSGCYLHMGEDKMMRLYNAEKESLRERERGNRETSLGSTACGKSPGLPVPTGTF